MRHPRRSRSGDREAVVALRQALFFLRSFFSPPTENLLRALQRCKNKIAPREGFYIIRVSKRDARPALLVVKDEPKKGRLQEAQRDLPSSSFPLESPSSDFVAPSKPNTLLCAWVMARYGLMDFHRICAAPLRGRRRANFLGAGCPNAGPPPNSQRQPNKHQTNNKQRANKSQIA